MDLKSMLNESQAHRGQPPPPRISTHTPQSSYDGRIDHTPSSDVMSARPTPYGIPSQAVDPRAQGMSSAGSTGGGGGGYFAIQSQSPHHNTPASASTPSVGPPSSYAQSPGSYGGVYTPRDNRPPSNPAQHNAPFVSPSPSLHHPPTPSSAHHPPYPPQNAYAHHQNNYPPNYQNPQFRSPPPPPANGLPPSQQRQISPASHYQSQPATPLGPPITYPRASPQTQRPTSRGQVLHQDTHLRRTSQSSVGSLPSREYNQYPQPPLPPSAAEHVRRESIQPPIPHDYRERSRSESVSPKTIPRPAPQREASASSQTLSQGRPSLPHSHSSQPLHHTASHDSSASHSAYRPVQPSSVSSGPDRQTSVEQTLYQSPASSHPLMLHDHLASTAASTPTTIKEEPMLATNDQANTSLKRRASNMSEPRPTLPHKRPRHEKPVWALSVRVTKDGRERPLRFIDAPPRNHRARPGKQEQARPAPVATIPLVRRETSHPWEQNGAFAPAEEGKLLKAAVWEPTIADRQPIGSVEEKIGDWILTVVSAIALPPESTIEIEAKVGRIIDSQDRGRMNLPIVESEVMLNTPAFGSPGISFESIMTIDQHKLFNEYLNRICRDRAQELLSRPDKQEIRYVHLKENDEFYELSEEGKQQLHPNLIDIIENQTNMKRRKEVRVRRTLDQKTGAVKATIIKTRLADKEIFNPGYDFDYRISISVETTYSLPMKFLTPVQGLRGRNKDRMSYRHMMYQVDLTQVSHGDQSGRLEHELEVEIDPKYVHEDINEARAGRTTEYTKRIRGLVDNARLLARLKL